MFLPAPNASYLHIEFECCHIEGNVFLYQILHLCHVQAMFTLVNSQGLHYYFQLKVSSVDAFPESSKAIIMGFYNCIHIKYSIRATYIKYSTNQYDHHCSLWLLNMVNSKPLISAGNCNPVTLFSVIGDVTTG